MSDFDYAVWCCEAAMGLCDPPLEDPTIEELFEDCFECPDNE